jgi:hypothetical protein
VTESKRFEKAMSKQERKRIRAVGCMGSSRSEGRGEKAVKSDVRTCRKRQRFGRPPANIYKVSKILK